MEDTFTELIDPYADLERASLAAFDGDVMVGYMKVRHKPSADEVHRVFLDGGVHPGYQRRGVGTTLVEAGIKAARVMDELHRPVLKLVVDVRKAEHIAGVPELLRSQGFAPVRHYERMEHPHSVTIPGGLRIEPWSPGNDEDFRLVRNASYQDCWGAVPLPADQWQNKITSQAFRRVSWSPCTGRPTPRAGRRERSDRTRVAGRRRTGLRPGQLERGERGRTPRIFAKAGFTPTMRYVRWPLNG